MSEDALSDLIDRFVRSGEDIAVTAAHNYVDPRKWGGHGFGTQKAYLLYALRARLLRGDTITVGRTRYGMKWEMYRVPDDHMNGE